MLCNIFNNLIVVFSLSPQCIIRKRKYASIDNQQNIDLYSFTFVLPKKLRLKKGNFFNRLIFFFVWFLPHFSEYGLENFDCTAQTWTKWQFRWSRIVENWNEKGIQDLNRGTFLPFCDTKWFKKIMNSLVVLQQLQKHKNFYHFCIPYLLHLENVLCTIKKQNFECFIMGEMFAITHIWKLDLWQV